MISFDRHNKYSTTLPARHQTRREKLYTLKEWTERFRHYIKRIYNVDIKQMVTDDTVPIGEPWDTKEQEIRQDFICGAGPSAIGIITRGESNMNPDYIKIDKLIQVFWEYYMPSYYIILFSLASH